MKTILLLLTLCATACAQNVGDFIIREKISTTGRTADRVWPKGASTLWGTNSSSLPAKIIVGSGLTLNTSTNTLSASGGAGTWGSITGTLSAQTDLNTALGLKLATATAASTYAPISHNQAWSTITATPTTLAGYGIADAITAATAASTYAPISHTQAWSTITSRPTTLAGYGIADAITAATAASTYEPVQTAASQAEAEAGTETAIRKFSPLRVKQAITALGGGGGGATIVRGSGTLQGYTVAPIPATAPPALTLEFNTAYGVYSVELNGTVYTFTNYTTDPLDGTLWVDTSTFDATVIVNNFISAFTAAATANNFTLTNPSYAVVSIETTDTGAAVSATYSNIMGSAVGTSTGGGSGTNLIPGSGQVSEVTLISQDGTKAIKPLRFGVSGAGVSTTVQFALKVSGTYYPISSDMASDATTGEPGISTYFAELVTGRASASLVARMTGGVPTGGSLTCWAIVQQN